MVAGRFQQREFETKEGEKRNVIELVADEVGPSLRWAQAQVERISRDSANAGGFSGGGSSGGAPKPASDPIYGDEEPF
jgi:single-strand DNA-binding protein